MENVDVNLIIFIFMAIISGVVWLANKIKEIQTGRPSPPVVSREDLPEKTRQMLYGGEVQMAKPKQGQPVHPQTQRSATSAPVPRAPQPPAAPRQLPDLSPRRTVVAGGRGDTASARPTARTPAREEMSPRQLQAMREQQAAAHRAAQALAEDEMSPHELQALRERQEAAAHPQPTPEEMTPRQLKALHEQQARAEQQRRVLEQAKKLEERAKHSVAAQHAEPAAPKAARPARRRSHWLSDANDARRGIVLAEILGPPKALQ